MTLVMSTWSRFDTCDGWFGGGKLKSTAAELELMAAKLLVGMRSQWLSASGRLPAVREERATVADWRRSNSRKPNCELGRKWELWVSGGGHHRRWTPGGGSCDAALCGTNGRRQEISWRRHGACGHTFATYLASRMCWLLASTSTYVWRKMKRENVTNKNY
jgi:hypothetical protein